MLACRADGSDGPALGGGFAWDVTAPLLSLVGGPSMGLCWRGGRSLRPVRAHRHTNRLPLLWRYLCKQEWESLPQHGLLLKILF